MLIETSLPERDLRQIPELARQAEALGFDGIGQPELKHDPLFILALAAPATNRVYLASSVLIAFPRSPMVVAYQSHDLQALSKGRLVVGLGTQVKGHIQRRFSTVWDSPGPRLREYVLSLRAIWDTWQNGTPLDFQGDFYNFTLMTPEFSPEAHAFAPPRVEIAAVNNYNARLAGEVCDGLRVHPMTTPGYLRDVLWPQVRRGAAKSGRSLDTFRMIGGGFIATGPNPEAIARAREDARYRIAFYASTRTYLPVLEHHGWQEINDKLRRLIAENRWDDLPSIISDDILDGFCISGTYQEIPGLVRERLGGLVDCLGLSMPVDPANPSDDYRDFLRRMREIPGASEAKG